MRIRENVHIDLDPEIFFLLFIPPLLFADGWRMPKREFWHLRVPIIAMALVLSLIHIRRFRLIALMTSLYVSLPQR